MRNLVDDKRPLVILPLKYLEEVKNAPQDKLSFALFVEKVMHTLAQWRTRKALIRVHRTPSSEK
jgi:hypothetical protein